jgi:4-hydroxybenzoate polyprenyltransferase
MGTPTDSTASATPTLSTTMRGLIRTMRPKQWSKNCLIFIPILFDRQFTNPQSLLRVVFGFFLLCLAASTIYLINDLVDIDRDRLHPIKKNRPIPAGQLPIPVAIGAAIILPIISVGGALLYSIPLALVLIAYLTLHIAYSFYLKNIVIVDVFAIAAGFVLRVLAGAVVITVAAFSPWLYVVAGSLSLFLAVGKRRQELLLLAGNAIDVRATYKHYNMALLDDMLRMVTTCTVVAYTIYTLEAPTNLARNRNAMVLTVPFAVYLIFRYLYLIHVEHEGGAPDELLFKDKPLLVTVILWGLVVFAVLYVGPLL